MKVKCDTMIPTMIKTLMKVEFLRKMNHSHQMLMRPKDITDPEVRGFNDGEVLQRAHNVDQMLQDVEFQ
jgi:hypothetical protein